MLRRSLTILQFMLTAPLVLSCTAGADGQGAGTNTTNSTGGASAGGQGGAGASGGSTVSVGGGFAVGGQGGEGGTTIIDCDPLGPDDDVDQDGFTPNQGDCEDCDPNRNPNAIEVPTKQGDTAYDENCNDEIDEAPEDPCDDAIDVDEMDATAAARAIELCKVSEGENDWGLVSAEWVMADGSPPPSNAGDALRFHLGHGFLDHLGVFVDVREGARMLSLSSGAARNIDDPDYQSVDGFDKLYDGAFAEGFPKESPACPGTITGDVHDATGVELVIRTPSNAKGFSFDFDFFTYEWPGFVCNTFNDFFIAILEPFPEGQLDGNISYDADGNPISVNNALLEVCGCEGNPPNACLAGGKMFNCSLGNSHLLQTGFGFDTSTPEYPSDHGATGWLRTTAPVGGNEEIHLRFVTHDSGDGILDTTTLIDNLKWVATAGTQVGTTPVPQ